MDELNLYIVEMVLSSVQCQYKMNVFLQFNCKIVMSTGSIY